MAKWPSTSICPCKGGQLRPAPYRGDRTRSSMLANKGDNRPRAVAPTRGDSRPECGGDSGTHDAVARRSRCMVMQHESDVTDDNEINDHSAWRCIDAHIDPIVSD
ncbi:hypothetical protein GW17_00040387 [Ensete ventricosum]|nr:hypothetical protein GW17_00040387 [Ensete ventricosum]